MLTVVPVTAELEAEDVAIFEIQVSNLMHEDFGLWGIPFFQRSAIPIMSSWLVCFALVFTYYPFDFGPCLFGVMAVFDI